jgi:diacylglycerol kinase (ATP)
MTGTGTGPGPEGSAASVLVIFNPAAGRRRARRIAAALHGLRAAGIGFLLRRTEGRGDAEHLAREAGPEATVVVAGGDGTANEAANGLLAAGGGRLAVIPLGTANVLAAELGIEGAAGGIAALEAGRILGYQPGLANGRGFLMMAGVGFDAHVVAGTSPRTKRLLGKGAYVLEMLRQLRRFPFPSYRVTVDGVVRQAASVVVARGHFYAGRFVLAPEAQLDQASLHVCLFRRAGRIAVLRYAIALWLGRISRGPGLEILVGRQILIEGPVGDPVQGDGDIIAKLPVLITLSPTAIDLVRGAG